MDNGVAGTSEDPQEIAKRALEYQESERKLGRNVSPTEAVMHVTKELER